MSRRLETALIVLAAIVLYDRRVTRMVNEAEDYTAQVADSVPLADAKVARDLHEFGPYGGGEAA